MKEPGFAAAGENPESRIQEIHLTCSPDKKSHTAQEPRAHGWLRQKESRGFSSQAPPPPAAPPCDVLSSCGHHSPQVLESLTGRAGKLVKQLAWIPEFQLCFFLIRLFHHFFKKKKIGYTSITSLLFLLSICLLLSSLPSQVTKHTTCCTSVTASTALAN